MTAPSGVGDIENEIGFQRRTWAVERFGWGVMGLVIMAALAGAFSGGALSRRTTSDESGALRIEYDRLLRLSSEHTWTFDVAAPATAGAALQISQALLDAFDIVRLEPEPAAAAAGPDGMVVPIAAPTPDSAAS